MITEGEYKKIADELRVMTAAVKAVHEVEAAGKAFNDNGTIVILFEEHRFYRYLKENGKDVEELSKKYPTLVFKYQTREHYATGRTFEERQIKEHLRFRQAIEIDPVAAFKSEFWSLSNNGLQC